MGAQSLARPAGKSKAPVAKSATRAPTNCTRTAAGDLGAQGLGHPAHILGVVAAPGKGPASGSRGDLATAP